MSLQKRTAGTPLTDAELRQRRDAARARWAAVAGATAAGAVGGAAVGAGQQAVRNENRAAAQVRNLAVHAAERMDAAEAGVRSRAAERDELIRGAFAWRRRGTMETQRERQRRFTQTLEEARRPETVVQQRPRPPVVGTQANALIYTYQIDNHRRRLNAEQRHLDRLEAREKAHFDTGEGTPVEPREIRAVRQRVDRIKREITTLEQFRIKHFERIGRAAHQRTSGGQTVDVDASVVRQSRGGETIKQLGNRISRAKTELTTRERIMGDLQGRRTERLAAAARTQVLTDTEMAVREAFRRNLYGRAMRIAALRGGRTGALLGLSVGGIGALAHYLTTTKPRRRKPQELAKAAPRDPESMIGRGIAETFRAWIDRLLGHSDQPLDLGEDLVHALAPGITQAFAEGATTPPVGQPAGYHIDVDFDVLNPAVRRHMADYALDRIVDITSQQRDAIRTTLMQQSVLQGIGPIEVARTIREAIGLTPYQQAVVQRYRQELQDLDPAALERKLRDRRFDPTVRRAIERGEALAADQIDRIVAAYHRRMLAMRAQTIARTEAIRATSYGAVARAQEVLDLHPDLTVIKRWMATDDERTRDTHRDLNGREVEGMETAFITKAGNQLRWPVDQNGVAEEVIKCRCAVAFRFIPKAGQLQAVAV